MKLTTKYKQICNEIAKEFSKKYADGDFYYVGNEPGDVCNMGDLFLDTQQMVLVLDLDLSVDEFYDVWDYFLEVEGVVNLSNIVKYGVDHWRKILA